MRILIVSNEPDFINETQCAAFSQIALSLRKETVSTAAEQSMSKVVLLISIIICTSCLGNLSQTALNAMFTTMAPAFSIDVSFGQLVTTIYMLVLGITVPLVTFLMRRFPLKSIVLWAIGFLFAGALVDFIAWDFTILILGRILQAISAGITMPMMMSVIMMSFPRGKQATVMGIAGIAMGFAPNIGPTIGGWIVSFSTWRMFFVLLMACSALLFIIAIIGIAYKRLEQINVKLDYLSFVLSAIGLGGILMGFTNVSNYEWGHPLVWLPLLVGITVLIVFVRRQQKIDNPLINMAIFSSWRYSAGFWAINLLSACFMGITLILPLFVENCWGGSALEAGLALLPGTICAFIFNPLAGLLSDRIGYRPVVIAGSLCLVTGSIAMVFVNESMAFAVLLVMQTLRSAGVSLLMSPLTSWSLEDLQPKIMVDGSSCSAAMRQAAAAMGTALMVFAITLGPALGSITLGYQLAFGVSALFAVATLVLNFTKLR